MSLLLNCSELISFLPEPCEYLWECVFKFVDAFQGIVESDDATVACVALHIVHYVIGCEQTAVVARHYVPHHYLEAAIPEDAILHEAYPSMRWAEKVGVEYIVGFLDVRQVGPRCVACSGDVVIGVVADAVAPQLHFLEQMWVFLGVFPYHEECGFGSEAVQCVKDERCGFGDWSVVESQENHLPVLVYPPQSVGI